MLKNEIVCFCPVTVTIPLRSRDLSVLKRKTQFCINYNSYLKEFIYAIDIAQKFN